jgi:hypothetical protein
MRLARMSVVLVAALGLAACPDGDRQADTGAATATDTPATAAGTPGAQTAEMGMERIDLRAVGQSNVSGEASIAPDGQTTKVMVRLTGGTPGQKDGHIHSGTCDNIGPVVVALEPVNVQQGGAGTSTSEVNLPVAQVMNGQHVISYHQSGGDPGPPVVCGEIPQQGGGIGL